MGALLYWRMIYKRCSRCGKRIPEGQQCSCIKAVNKLRHKEYDKYSRDQKSKAFYQSKEWIDARARAIELDDGIDVYAYMTSGQIMAADTVHHIIPLKDDWSKRVDINNLMSLSHSSHSTIERLYKQNKQETQESLQRLLEAFRAKE